MIDTFKLLGVTVVLTLLIWTAADSMVNETASITIAIEPVPSEPNSDLIVSLDNPTRSFEIQITGPRRAIESVQTSKLMKFRVPVPENLKMQIGGASFPIEHDTLKRQLTEISRDYQRLTVVSVQPADLPLKVDRIVTKEIVLATDRLTLGYESKPVIQPSKVACKMRESRALELASTNQWNVLDVTAEVERQLRERLTGEPITIVVPLEAKQFGTDAEFSPRNVDVTATVQSARTTAEVPAVPIRLAMSFANLQRPIRAVTAEGAPLTLVTQTISVSGPTEEVGKLLRGESRAFGLVQLKDPDFEDLGVLRSFVPEFQLPKGLELNNQPDPVEFRLIESTKDTSPREG